MIELNRIYNEDCLEGMKRIPDKSIDMILCDLPYGTTACKWDTIIPFEPLWEQYNRIIKDNGAIVLTAIQPFTSALVMSKPDLFSHSWVWKKTKATNYVQARKKPMKYHEDIVVFAKKQHTYNPQMRKGFNPYKKAQRENYDKDGAVFKDTRESGSVSVSNGERFPSTVIEFSNPNNKSIHPTQKPVALFEYLIKTYTNEGETVLDNCIGSGTTAIACINTNRNFIGFEMDKHYCDIANERIERVTAVAEIDKVLDSLPFKEPICNSCIHMKSGKYETQCLNCIHGELVFEDNYSQTKINKE